MDDYQDNGSQPGDAVNISANSTGHLKHHTGSRGIESQTTLEKDQMPPLQSTGEPFAPDTDRIEDKRQTDQYGRYQQFTGHSLPTTGIIIWNCQNKVIKGLTF